MALRELKVCLLGDTGVGKSSIVWRFVEDSFDPNINPTIGPACHYLRGKVKGQEVPVGPAAASGSDTPHTSQRLKPHRQLG